MKTTVLRPCVIRVALGLVLGLALLLPAGSAVAADAAASGSPPPPEGQREKLLPPQKTGGMPLMAALAARHTQRKFREAPVGAQDLSNLLWAAFGVNREDGRRTMPTAMNRQQLVVYVARENGVWFYDAPAHELVQVLDKDIRPAVGGGPLTVLYAAPRDPAGSMHVGSAYQNVGLYCASAGLANVVRTTGAKEADGAFPLPPDFVVHIVHSVGLP